MFGAAKGTNVSSQFSALDYFKNGEQGYWLDPSDFSTMFQDAAGSTPVTAVGQQVRRILDKSGRGNHFIQTNTANAPVLGREPRGSQRRNLLTFTEEFDNPIWIKAGTTILSDVVSAPNGTMTADEIRYTGGGSNQFNAGLSIAVTVPIVISFWARRGPESTGLAALRVGLRDNGIIVVNTFNYSPTEEWERFSYQYIPNGTGVDRIYFYNSGSASNNVPFYLWGVQLETGSTATPYQRVGTAFDVTEFGIPTVHYLSFDGTDDWLQSAANINPGEINKVQIFTGFRMLSNVATGMLVEASAQAASNPGSFNINVPLTPASGNYRFLVNANSNVSRPVTAIPPFTSVLTALSDIAAPLISIQLNQDTPVTGSDLQGTGNFLTYPHFIGRRAGTQNPFNGRLYQIIVRYGPNLSSAAITRMRNFITSKTALNAPNIITPPSLTLDPISPGDIPSINAGFVTAGPQSSKSWEWEIDAQPVLGQTNSFYIVQDSDTGKELTARQIETNYLGLTSASTPQTTVWNPALLYQNTEQGYWLDPSDFSTMFQDINGTIPITAVGQIVARINDKSGRNNHFIQPTFANRPTIQQDTDGRFFLSFDGVNDALFSANNINPGLVDKVQVFTGVFKTNDTTIGTIISSSPASDTGSFLMQGPSSNATPTYLFRHRGSDVQRDTTFNNSIIAGSGVANTITGISDIAGSTATIRVDGVTRQTNNNSTGTGNYSSHLHYIGNNGSNNSPFNGRIYQVIVRFGNNLSENLVRVTERFIAHKTGIINEPELSPYSSLNFDFNQLNTVQIRRPGAPAPLNEPFSSVISFTRNSIATRVNSSGQIEQVAANIPRLDHDPVTLQPRGLLIEGQRTNLLLRSGEMHASPWGTVGTVTRDANAALAPDGTMTATRINNFSDAAGQRFNQAVTSGATFANNTFTGSVWLRAEDASEVDKEVQILLIRTGSTAIVQASVNVLLTLNWQRISVSVTTLADTAGVDMRFARGGTNFANSFLVWGAQLEVGPFASSYIPTSASQVTRVADEATISGANFTDWFNQGPGTFLVEASGLTTGSSNFLLATGNARIGLLRGTNDRFTFYNRLNGNIDVSLTGGANFFPNSVRGAVAFESGNTVIAANGSETASTATFVLNETQLNIGRLSAAGNTMFGAIRRIRYWPIRLTNKQLQKLTR